MRPSRAARHLPSTAVALGIAVGLTLAHAQAHAQSPAAKPVQPAAAPMAPPAKPATAAPAPAVLGTPALGAVKPKSVSDGLQCLLEPRLIADVGSPVEGTLSQVLIERGDSVRAGQIVARLNANVEAATLELKRAQLEYGQRKVQRNDELFKKSLISASDKDELETQTRIAELEVKQQQQVLALRTITSPINGVVIERFLAPGNHISQEKIARIAQIDPLNVETIAPVSLFGAIKPGAMAEVKLEPLFPGSYKARVTVVDRVVDAASGTFRVRLELSNPGNRIPSGIKCAVRFAP